MSEDAIRVFKIDEFTKRPYLFSDPVHVSITFEMDSDLEVINRQVYNFFDWIGDIGGLGEACFFICFAILGIIHLVDLDNMIIAELFRVSKAQSRNQITAQTSAC